MLLIKSPSQFFCQDCSEQFLGNIFAWTYFPELTTSYISAELYFREFSQNSRNSRKFVSRIFCLVKVVSCQSRHFIYLLYWSVNVFKVILTLVERLSPTLAELFELDMSNLTFAFAYFTYACVKNPPYSCVCLAKRSNGKQILPERKINPVLGLKVYPHHLSTILIDLSKFQFKSETVVVLQAAW